MSLQADLLTRTVNVLKGPPPELVLWSHHDVPEIAEALWERHEKLTRAKTIADESGIEAQRERDEALAEVARLKLKEDSLREYSNSLEAQLADIEAMRCRFCHAIAPENDWPNTECCVCTYSVDNNVLRDLIEELSGLLGDYERGKSPALLDSDARGLIERVRKLGPTPKVEFSG